MCASLTDYRMIYTYTEQVSEKYKIDWRKRHVFELSSKCNSHLEIAKSLQILIKEPPTTTTNSTFRN